MHASLLTNVNCTTFFHIFYLQFDSINRIFVVMHKAYYGDAMRMKMIFITEGEIYSQRFSDINNNDQ